MYHTSKIQRSNSHQSQPEWYRQQALDQENSGSKPAFFPAMNVRSGLVQTSLEINAPDDKYEREADAIAEKIAGNDLSAANTSLSEGTGIQRMCAECEEEMSGEVQRSISPVDQHAAGAMSAPDGFDSQLSATKGKGEPMDTQTQEEMSQSFGRDLSEVRIHTNSAASGMAKNIQAKAFTHKQDIYFGEGEFDPQSKQGKHLLAHELTHVVQQSGPSIQRLEDTDWQIRGLYPGRHNHPNMIFFDYASDTIDTDEQPKISSIAIPNDAPLVLKGSVSEEGTGDNNKALAERRIQAVDEALSAVGHTGAKRHEPAPKAGFGSIDYRRARNVEVYPEGGSASGLDCDTMSKDIPCADYSQYPDFFTTGREKAVEWIGDVVAALGTSRTTETNTLLERCFGESTDDVAGRAKTRFEDLRDHMNSNLSGPGDHRCGTMCDPNCAVGATAYNTNWGSDAVMTLCPPFFEMTDVNERAGLLMHESVHGTLDIKGIDHSYSWMRMMEFINTDRSLENPDSIVLFARNLVSPGSMTEFHGDDRNLMSNITDYNTVRESVAWVNRWVLRTQQILAWVYKLIHENMNAAVWPHAADATSTKALNILADEFGRTRPPAVPGRYDKTWVAALNDRFSTFAIYSSYHDTAPMTFSHFPDGDVRWNYEYFSIVVNDAWLAMSPMDRLLTLLEKLIDSVPDISDDAVPRYVRLTEKITKLENVGGPE